MCECVACMYSCIMCVQFHKVQKRTSASPGTGITEGCKPSCECWVLNLGPPVEQPVLLPAELSLELEFPLLLLSRTSLQIDRWWHCRYGSAVKSALPLQRTQVWLKALTSGGSLPPVTPVLGVQDSLAATGTCAYVYGTYKYKSSSKRRIDRSYATFSLTFSTLIFPILFCSATKQWPYHTKNASPILGSLFFFF